ncbi:MAG: DUF3429 domain-containing protein [Stappia sp.]|uniref:DUF3429 domain-containing protein n=1 Tax=Stappia sp. TaxID=1870903 RepID=UPI000C6A3C27|nr:DUF3429 domain-containing protein [Stappia sp.]MAA99044.1 DUF3429 domain-containing protein [Stappia sp.]MBM18622.1 DUF3429 domain-containing protein [Stappia sp.]
MSDVTAKDTPPPRGQPSAAAWLGLAGLVPFVAGAAYLTVAAFEVVSPAATGHAALAVMLYGAVILSFLGGARWGAAMQAGERGAAGYAFSVLPSLVAWIATMLPPVQGLLMLAAGLLLQGMADTRAASAGLLPAWYGGLRARLTMVAVVSLLIATGSLLLVLREGLI